MINLKHCVIKHTFNCLLHTFDESIFKERYILPVLLIVPPTSEAPHGVYCKPSMM